MKNNMKQIKTEDAVGMVLCHDITKIVPNEFKGTAFKKGHIIKEEDIKELLAIGKDNLYVWENKEGILHENDAALRLKELVCGEGLEFSEVSEGKIAFTAAMDGLLKIDKEELLKINSLGEIIVSTIQGNIPIKKGEKIGATRIIPLVIDEEKIIKAEQIIAKGIIKVIPIKSKKIGVVTTGNEVFYGRIKDAFGPIIQRKVEEYGCKVIGQKILPDDQEKITEAINEFIDEGAEMVLCTGGMSVDPDDLTPTAIKMVGGDLITYGAPVLPGGMFLLAYKDNTPILGLPGCVMYTKRSVFDLVLPRVLSDERLNKEDIVAYGHGGFCLGCDVCRFPYCSFGK